MYFKFLNIIVILYIFILYNYDNLHSSKKNDNVEQFYFSKGIQKNYYKSSSTHKLTIDWQYGYYTVQVSSKEITDIATEKFNLSTIKDKTIITDRLKYIAQKILLQAILDTQIYDDTRVVKVFKNNINFKNKILASIYNDNILMNIAYKSKNEILLSMKYRIYGHNSLASILLSEYPTTYSELFKEKSIFRLNSIIKKKIYLGSKKNKRYNKYSSIILDSTIVSSANVHDRLTTVNLIKPLSKKFTIPKQLSKLFFYDKVKHQISFLGRMNKKTTELLIKNDPNNKDFKLKLEMLMKKSIASNKAFKVEYCIFPKIQDSNGLVIYSLDIFRNDLRKKVEDYYINYIYDFNDIYKIELVGSNPLIIPVIDFYPKNSHYNFVVSSDSIHDILDADLNIFVIKK